MQARTSGIGPCGIIGQSGEAVEFCRGNRLCAGQHRHGVVRIERRIDPETGELPTDGFTGFLPPNDETGRGQGFVEYSIRPRSDAPTGTVIRNSATIVFDFNEPIDTNEVFNALDADPPTSAVAPLPAEQGKPNIALSWTSQDPGDASGLASFTVYVSTDDGAFVPFITNTTDSQAVFPGQAGHTYAFYSLASDNAGNVEVPPSEPDATTTVPLIPGDIDRDGDVDLVDFITFARCFGLTAASPQCSAEELFCSDLDSDGEVTLSDFVTFAGVFGQPATGSVPNCQ